MGTFFHPITLTGPAGASETLEALVDTGASFSTVPGPILERLGVRAFDKARLRLATGQVVERDIGAVTAELDGLAARPVICVFGEPDAPPAIGAQTLESFLLGVDPDQRRLVPLEGWWATSATESPFRLVADYRMTGDQPQAGGKPALTPYGRLRMSWVPMRRRITISPSTSKVSR